MAAWMRINTFIGYVEGISIRGSFNAEFRLIPGVDEVKVSRLPEGKRGEKSPMIPEYDVPRSSAPEVSEILLDDLFSLDFDLTSRAQVSDVSTKVLLVKDLTIIGEKDPPPVITFLVEESAAIVVLQKCKVRNEQ